MDSCANCRAALQPEWKFCIRCGVAVTDLGETRPLTRRAPAEPTVPVDADIPLAPERPLEPREPIPSAIRPAFEFPASLDLHELHGDDAHDEVEREQPRRLDLPLLAGIALAIVGAALIVYIAIVLTARA